MSATVQEMMRRVLHRGHFAIMAAADATHRLVGLAGETPADRSVVSSVMQTARRRFREKAAPKLAAIVGCDVKTAERYFAGTRTPNGEAMVAMFCSPVGPDLLEAATQHLPPTEFRGFWSRMAVAVGDALREREDAL